MYSLSSAKDLVTHEKRKAGLLEHRTEPVLPKSCTGTTLATDGRLAGRPTFLEQITLSFSLVDIYTHSSGLVPQWNFVQKRQSFISSGKSIAEDAISREMMLLAEMLSELILSIDPATLLLAIRVTAVLGPSIHPSQKKIDSKKKSRMRLLVVPRSKGLWKSATSPGCG